MTTEFKEYLRIDDDMARFPKKQAEIRTLVRQFAKLTQALRPAPGAPIELPREGGGWTPATIFMLALDRALLGASKTVTCSGLYPGIWFHSQGQFEAPYTHQPADLLAYAWLLLEAPLARWAADPRGAPALGLDLTCTGLHLSLDAVREAFLLPRAGAAEIRVLGEVQVRLACAYTQATHDMLGLKALARLPLPIRFRASGALESWKGVLQERPELRAARHALADTQTSFGEARDVFLSAVAQDFDTSSAEIRNNLDVTGSWLAFWLRDGALYEPTPALGTLLGQTDWSQDIPVRYIRLPHPAVCILLPAKLQGIYGEMRSILLLEHAGKRGGRALSVFAYEATTDAYGTSLGMDKMLLSFESEEESLSEVISRNVRRDRVNMTQETLADLERSIRAALDYAVKVLLYLAHDGRQVVAQNDYSAAPRAFPGLGKRRREQQLADIEQLYDRYIVGPEELPEATRLHADEGAEPGHAVAPHWRRGHFRLQPWGPQASLRKLIFVAPVIVRADRLAGG